MPQTLSPRRRTSRFRPDVQSLEDRSLLAGEPLAAKITLAFPSMSVGGVATKIMGDLPGNLIDVVSFNAGSFNNVQIGTSIGSGRVSLEPIVVSLRIGRHTTGLYSVLTSGGRFTTAQIIVRDSAARTVMTYTLGSVFISRQQLTAESGGLTTTETVELTFGSLQIQLNDPMTNRVVGTGIWNQVTATPTMSRLGFQSSSISTANLPQPASAEPNRVAASAASPFATTVQLVTARGGTSTRLTATVTSTSGTPTGSVAFYNGKTSLGIADVGPDGKASLTVPIKLNKNRLFALYGGGVNSQFAPGSSVTANRSATLNLFRRFFQRPMTADEWSLTSMWLQQGLTTSRLAAIYKQLARRS